MVNAVSEIEPLSGIQASKKQNVSSPLTIFNVVGSLRDREVACSASECKGASLEFCV